MIFVYLLKHALLDESSRELCRELCRELAGNCQGTVPHPSGKHILQHGPKDGSNVQKITRQGREARLASFEPLVLAKPWPPPAQSTSTRRESHTRHSKQ